MMFRKYIIWGLALSFISHDILIANAARRKAGEPISVDEIFDVANGSKTITCGGLVGGKYLSGKIKVVDGVTLFELRNDAVKIAKSKWKKEKNTTKKKKLEQKYLKLSKAVKAENKTCSYGPGGAPPSPTATPGGAQPTATPKSLGNFDSNGNVTADGKVKFGIPSNLSANLNTGKSVYTSDCKGCHTSEKTGRSFSYYKSAISASPMFITNMSDQEIADITAYLRRFELN